MIALQPSTGRPLSLLFLGAHSDDIEIAAAGTVLHLLDRNPGTQVRWVVFSGSPKRATEARASAEALLQAAASVEMVTFTFRDGFFPFNGTELKEAFEELASGPEPDLVFTHAREDLHQDHRLVGDLAWNTWRNHMILEYEIPKYEGFRSRPNLYVPLDRGIVDRKLDHLARHFASQRDKPWYDSETFRGTLRLRGMESRSPSGFAEAFKASKVLMV